MIINIIVQNKITEHLTHIYHPIAFIFGCL